jgi:hypothetical protein
MTNPKPIDEMTERELLAEILREMIWARMSSSHPSRKEPQEGLRRRLTAEESND